MPSKKKQHYVPRFYLRNFSWENQKAINLYNKASGKIIIGGNLSNQCYEPYFYGKDLAVENAFEILEGVASIIIRGILSGGCPPVMMSAAHRTLLTYVLLQFSRTKHSAYANHEMVEKVCKNIIEKQKKFPADLLQNIRIGLNNPTAISLWVAVSGVPIAMDLRLKVLRNVTPLQFLTSDNPVTLYNSCYERARFGSYTGLATKGLQIFLPLSPQYLLAFYDAATYKIGEKKRFVVDIVEVNDVRQMNDLQWLNCLENLYFHRDFPRIELESIRRRNQSREHLSMSILNEYQELERPGGTTSSILHMHRPDHKIVLRLQCIRQLRTALGSEFNDMRKPLRNSDLVQIHREFMELVRENRYNASEFQRFIKDRKKS